MYFLCHYMPDCDCHIWIMSNAPDNQTLASTFSRFRVRVGRSSIPDVLLPRGYYTAIMGVFPSRGGTSARPLLPGRLCVSPFGQGLAFRGPNLEKHATRYTSPKQMNRGLYTPNIDNVRGFCPMATTGMTIHHGPCGVRP